MPATWRVRSRSTAAAGAVHVRARAMACRSGADSDTGGGHGLGPPSRRARPAIRGGGDGAAIGHQDAPARAKGGRAPSANSAGARDSGGIEGEGGAPPSPASNVAHWVCWLMHLSPRPKVPRRRPETHSPGGLLATSACVPSELPVKLSWAQPEHHENRPQLNRRCERGGSTHRSASGSRPSPAR